MGHKILPSFATLSQNRQALYDVLNEEEDFVCVMVVGGYLDRCLAALLTQHLSPGGTTDRLLSSRGILGTFQARVDLCYCLGFIPKEAKQNMDLIGEIRNTFGHAYEVMNFDNEEIVLLCEKLRYTKPDAYVVLGGEPNPEGPFAHVRDPRSKFSIIASDLITRILLTCHVKALQQPGEKDGGAATPAHPDS